MIRSILLAWSIMAMAFANPMTASAVTFTDASGAAGVQQVTPTWGVQWGDVNGDGWEDIYVNNHQYINPYTNVETPPALFLNQGNGTFTNANSSYGLIFEGDQHGAAFADFNNDGFLDLFQTQGSNQGNVAHPDFLYQNTGSGRFVDVAPSAGVDMPLARGRSACWFDYDNDGWVDLFVANVEGGGYGSAFFRNLGNGTFMDVSQQAGLVLGSMHSCSPVDFDNDGLIDFFGISYQKQKALILYKNNGDGTFTDQSAAGGLLVDKIVPKGFCWGDYDNDGDMDLYIPSSVHEDALAEEPAGMSLLSELTGGEVKGYDFDVIGPDITLDFYNYMWRLIPGAIYIGQSGFHPPSNPFTLSASDPAVQGMPVFSQTASAYVWLENNQWHIRGTTSPADVHEIFDGIMTTNGPLGGVLPYNLKLFTADAQIPNWLYENQGNGTFVEVAASAGVLDSPGGQSCQWADFDNDGYQDLYLVKADEIHNLPNRLYHNNGNKTFTDVAAASGVEANTEGKGESVAVADYDNDGFLDMIVTNGLGPAPYSFGPHILYRNDGNTNGWLEIKLIGTATNRDAIGAKVAVRAGGTVQTRQQTGGASAYSQNGSILHFGVGTAGTSGIQVTWPSGVTQTISMAAPNQRLTLQEPAIAVSHTLLTPSVSPGGTLRFSVSIGNRTAKSLQIGYWGHFILGNGSPYPGAGEAIGPVPVSIPPHSTVTKTIQYSIPVNAPLGNYSFQGSAGAPMMSWDGGGFGFTVVAP